MNKFQKYAIIGAGCIAAAGCGGRQPPVVTTFYSGNPAAILSQENEYGLRHALRLAPDEQVESALCKDSRYEQYDQDELSCAFKTSKRTLRLDAHRSDKKGYTSATLTVNPKGDKCESYLSLHSWNGKYSMSTASNAGKTRIDEKSPLYPQFEEKIVGRFNELSGAMYNLQTGAADYRLRGAQQQIEGALGPAKAPAKKTEEKSTEKTLEDALK